MRQEIPRSLCGEAASKSLACAGHGMPTPNPAHHTISLVTYRRNGEEVRTPVWFIVTEDGFWVFSFRDSWKARRIRNNPRVRFAPCDRTGKRILEEWADGNAQLADEAQRLEWLVGELKRKYSWRYFLIIQVFYPLFGKRGEKVAIQVTPDS